MIIIVLSGLIGISMIVGCGPKMTDLTPSPNKETIEKAPNWFNNPPNDLNHLFAVSTNTSRDLQMAIQKAKATAQSDLAQQLGIRLGNLTKQFQEEVGASGNSELLQQFTTVTKTVTDQTLIGSKVDKQEVIPESDIYRAYVLMSLPIGKANQLLMEKIKSNEVLHTRFRSTEAYKELDKEIQKMND